LGASPFFIVALGLFSAIALALANVSVKIAGDILVARAVLSASGALIGLPFAFFVPAPDAATFAALAVAIPAHFFYQLCLVGAMSRGDLSLVFPVMRGAAPLLTAGAAMLFLGESLSGSAAVGLAIASLAVIGFVLPPPGVRMRAHPDRVALIFAGLTAIGIALYNVADAHGVRAAPSPQTFIVWLFMADCLCIGTLALIVRRRALIPAVRTLWRPAMAAGALSVLSFGAALYGYSLTETARVSALRETSVVFAALMGWLWLGEGFGVRRVVCALVMVAGLALMQFG
jgi:drug/metabolite transporter (DMT)-like permease